ncbi:hypothetical protein HMPREF1199_00669 [Hoylesella oralis CC98A]|nr:hypothetical protein HMPREF1199_00669 [Hoylesella oralis CC98A]
MYELPYKNMIEKHINWIDWAKVFAVYLVVLGYKLYDKDSVEWGYRNLIYSFHMPLFSLFLVFSLR